MCVCVYVPEKSLCNATLIRLVFFCARTVIYSCRNAYVICVILMLLAGENCVIFEENKNFNILYYLASQISCSCIPGLNLSEM